MDMNHMPTYDGVLTRTQVKLIISRARKLGYRQHELPDALQEAAIELMDFKYNPAKSNGADENTAMCAVVDNRLCKVIRGVERDRARVDAIAPLVPHIHNFATDELSLDVRDALAAMPPLDCAVGQLITAGCSKAEAARRLGRDWHVVNRACKRIRKHFEQVGIDRWVL